MSLIKDPAESVVLEFDFSSDLAAVTTADVSVSLAAGYDADPDAFRDGDYSVSGAKVLQRISGGVDNADYTVRAVATHGADISVRSTVIQVRKA